MSDTRRRNSNWTVCSPTDGNSISHEGARLAVLMDIRDELQKLNRLLHCSNFIAIPNVLREIRSNTKRRKKRAAAKLKAVG